MRWLPPQIALLAHRGQRVAFRGPNQALGKSTVGAAELVYRLLGRHPFKPVPPAPIESFVVAGSWEQSQIVQAKVWDFVPKDMVADGCYYDPTKGAFTGKYPRLRLKNGSIAHFKSSRGETVSLASATLDYVWIDEPPASARVWSELQKRVLRRNGSIVLTFTPVNAPVEWIREECERGAITDLHYPLRAEYLVPVGASGPMVLPDGTPCDEAWIARLTEETLPHERPVVLGGEWEFRMEGAIFERSWRPEQHVSALPPTGTCRLALGVDYGDRENKQTSILVAVDDSDIWPRVWVLDEVVSDGTTTIDQDARAILAMLARQFPALRWANLDYARGDRVHRGGVETKGNRDLMVALARELRLPSTDRLQPRIRTVKRGYGQLQGSVRMGEKFLHQAMLRPGHFSVNPRCSRLIESMSRYNGADDGHKDAVDGLRYALWDWVFRPIRRGPVGVRLYSPGVVSSSRPAPSG